MRIAYVEDNPTNLALVERVASMNRHAVVSYAEGEIAAEELLHEQFDLILMDVELAGEMGGLQVVRNLRQAGVTTPIIAVTAYAMLGDRERCLEAGCNGYLPKPLPIAELLVLLAQYDAETKAKSAEPAAVTVSAAGSAAAPTTSTAASATSTAPVVPANPEIKPEVAKAPEPTISAPAGPAMPAPPMANTPPATVPAPSASPTPGLAPSAPAANPAPAGLSAPSVLPVPEAKVDPVPSPTNTLPTSTPALALPFTPEIKPDSAKTSEPDADVQSTPGESAQSPASTPEQRTP
jgi:CheY-like chemotaxis protein